ncbi:argininosuccinate synthase-related protein [Azotobacter beijerinckii]|uniref:argininosuccinate synthase n=1 Tax=Azotobacter beijerinckii TaxID=170623 RepID=A0A1I4IUW2_9GAMM|nr:argininosuccinate synthase-related protein [Azotobacter beijerinckii]SFB65231.1 argininosuccinate synthase [Azotobacter beijerinckii]SFL58132.1 argininosuccinate synthase [Azotobacter beijerinckii]
MIKPQTIRSINDIESRLNASSRVLCLYSGGLDGTFLLHRLVNSRCARIIALCVDLGGDPTTREIEERGQALGVETIFFDAKDAFANDFVAPSIIAQATYLGTHPICASLSRPLIARVAYDIAMREGCDMLLHTSSRSQNSLRRFNGALAALGFKGNYGSPFEETTIPRKVKIDKLIKAGIPITISSLFSTDTNLWGREFEYGELDDPEHVTVPESLYHWTKYTTEEPEQKICIRFEAGRPVAVNGSAHDLANLIKELNINVGRFGIGRYIGLEEIEDGRKVQEVREMPAAAILFDSYRRIEAACLSAECIREKISQEQLWVREAVEGRWFGSLRTAAQAFMDTIAKSVSGQVSYRINPSNMQFTSVIADNPLYIRNRDRYESADHI